MSESSEYWQAWKESADRYYASLDQVKLGLYYAYAALTDQFRYEYDRAFFSRDYAAYKHTEFWHRLYVAARDQRDQLSLELFTTEES